MLASAIAKLHGTSSTESLSCRESSQVTVEIVPAERHMVARGLGKRPDGSEKSGRGNGEIISCAITWWRADERMDVGSFLKSAITSAAAWMLAPSLFEASALGEDTAGSGGNGFRFTSDSIWAELSKEAPSLRR